VQIAVTTFGGDGGKSGISRYIIQLLREFGRAGVDNIYDIFLYGKERDIFLGDTGDAGRLSRLRGREFSDSMANPVRNIFWHQVGLPGIMRRSR